MEQNQDCKSTAPSEDILDVMEKGTTTTTTQENTIKKEFISIYPLIKAHYKMFDSVTDSGKRSVYASDSDTSSIADSSSSGDSSCSASASGTGSESGSGSGSDSSTAVEYLEDDDEVEDKPSAPWTVDLMDAAKKAIEEDGGWNAFLLHQKTCDSLELYEKTDEAEEEEKPNEAEQDSKEIKEEDDNSSSSSDYSSAVSDVSDDDSSSFQSKILDQVDDEEEESVLEQAKEPNPDHKRIAKLEQALADAEDMIATLIEEANSQHKEREILQSLLENAREQDAKHMEKIAAMQTRIQRKDAVIGQLRSNLKDQVETQRAKYESRLLSADSLLREAYDDAEHKKQEISILEQAAEQIKAEKIKEDAEKIELVCRLEEAHREMKLLMAQNATIKGVAACLERTVPKLESEIKIMRAKYVLQEHLAKENNRKRKSTNALFNQMKQRLVEKIESLDRHSNLITTRLEEHLEKQKKEAVQRELLQRKLQDANEKLDYFQKAAKYLESDLNQLKEKFEVNGIEKEVIAQVVNKERVKNDLQETHAKLHPSKTVTMILQSDLENLKKQHSDKRIAEKQVVSLQAKLRFACAKESLLSKALSIKNSENMDQEDRLKDMSEKLASLRSQLCMKNSENELLAAKLQDLEKQENYPLESSTESASASLDSAEMTKRKSCNRKVNSLEAELSLLQVPEVIDAAASIVDAWSAAESEKVNSLNDLDEHSDCDEDDEFVKEISDEDEDEWDFLSHATPIEQQELWC